MSCWSCGQELPAGARFCARCGVRQRSAGPSAPAWVLAAFAIGACIAAIAVLLYGLVLLQPQLLSRNPQEAQVETVLAWVLVVYGGILLVLQVAALTGLATGRDWGRLVATLACLLWCLTGFGLIASFPILYNLWRPQPMRR